MSAFRLPYWAEPVKTAKTVRVLLGPPGAEPFSVWVEVSEEAGKTLLRFAHAYDIQPQPGWAVAGRGLALTVEAVAGGVLTCRAN